MIEKIKLFLERFNSKKTEKSDKEEYIANMIVHHIQCAEQKPTAIIKK